MTKIISNKSNIDLDCPVVRPSLDLDFTQEELDPRITFTRGSIGTRVNRNRLIETVATNQPRFDYDPVTGECKGLLIEESRTNIVLNSTTLSSHSNSETTEVVTTETTSPDGTFNAYKIIGNAGAKARESIFTNAFTMNANSSYTASVFLKGTETRRYVVMWFDNTGPGNAAVEGPFYGASTFIDLLKGTSNNPSITKIIPYGNGWYRCYLTATVGASNLTNVYLNVSIGSPNGFNDIGNPSIYKYVGDGISGIYYWGPQVEAGAFPTSYIPTSASIVTRSADLADMTGTNFSSWYNQSEGTLYADLNNITTRTSLTYDRLVSLVGTDVNRNVISICTQTAAGGGAQNKFQAGVSYSPDGSYVLDTFTGAVSGGGPDRIGKAIIVYKKDNFAFTVNGITPLRDIIGDIPTCNRLLIFGAARYQPAPSGHIKRLTYYPRALKPNHLQYLTQ
jgi:hypothetical protein